MRSEFLRRHHVSLASVVVVFAAVIAVVLYALSVPGYASHRAEINDGGVWVTKGDSGQFGRLNKPISQLDGYAYTDKQAANYVIDVAQEGSSVIAVDQGSGVIYPMTVSRAELNLSAKVPVSGNAQVGLAGGTVAVLDPAKGSVSAVAVERDAPITDLAGLAGKPLATAGPDAALAVSQDGTVFAASAGTLVTIHRSGTGFAPPVRTKIATPADTEISVTAVGDQPVVLARPKAAATAATLILPGGTSATLDSPAGAVLQQPGPAANSVLVATPGALRSVSLNGGRPAVLAAARGGTPAAPVLVGGCVFAAWAGPTTGEYATTCDGTRASPVPIAEASTNLVFRVNRGKVMLNDRGNGRVWNLDTGRPRKVDNWDAVTKPRDNKQNKTKNDDATTSNRAQPPRPQPDVLGARPGTTTSLYVLDNDSDPSGGVLAISSITAKGGDAKLLSISPDGQTVDARMPAGRTQPISFSYTINGAKGQPVSADVTVMPRSGTENAPPTTRKNFVPRTWSVPAGGTVTVPVLGDWRDYTDGDSVVLSAASVRAGGGVVSTTPDGQLIYSAPDRPGPQTVDYTVADGYGGTAKGSVAINVQGPNDAAVPAVAAADYARGQVGTPITIQPLANDLPGSDPNSPTATLRLAGAIASPAGATVTTDLTTGTVTVKATKPGPLLLNYQAGYGYAAPAKGVIAVQVDPQGSSQPPVTAADTAVLHGQTPVIVDVLANDADPAGNLLVVQRAFVTDPLLASTLEIAVIDGRYVRLRSRDPVLRGVVSVSYVVSDGVTGDATGSISVTQLPPTDAGPVTLDDYATVRSGQSVGVAVLDNDASPSGSPLTLSKNVYGAPHPGELVVTPASAGSAYVSGRIVRFVAKPVAATTAAVIAYVAEDVAGNTQQGRLHVTIVPPRSKTNPNQNPLPPPLEGRAIAGQTIRIKVPSSGVDPDGDPVVVTGIGSAPARGRVLSSDARGIVYQAYPFVGNGGTDTFSYVVTDIYGASSTGTVRVAIVTPGDPQPPVAVDDTITTTPNTAVQVDVLANDLTAPGDRVTILPLSSSDPEVAAGHVKLAGERGPITVTSGDAKTPVSFKYRISNGIAEATAQVTVRAAADANLPPVAFDQYPPTVAVGAKSVQVDLTKGDYDPDSAAKPVVVTPAGAVDGKVNLTLDRFPRVVPYVIRDAKGATATAVVYLPAVGAGAPSLKPGQLIRIKSGETKTVDITSYVVDPANKPVRTTVAELITTSPAVGLTSRKPTDATHVTLVAAKDYNGPAALSFQVTNGKSLVDPAADKALISVPVQVGDERPVLRCPSTPLQLVEGGNPVSVRPATYCHTWTPNPANLATMKFTGTWAKQPAGVTVSGSGSPVLRLVADSASAKAGSTGALTVSANGATSTLRVEVIKAPKLEVSPLTVDGVEAGKARQIDLTSSLRSYLGKPTLNIVGKPVLVGSSFAAAISTSGARLTVTPDSKAKGTMRIQYVASDVPDQNRTDHQTPGEITLNLIGRPDAPINVQPERTVLSKTVNLRWTAPAANGTPITRYLVRYAGGQQDCGAAPACAISGLNNGRAYTFIVVAYNAIGDSPPSAASGPATPDAVPTAVQGFTVSNPQDHQLTLRWQPLVGGNEFSPVLKYRILGGPTLIETAATSAVANGLDNNQQYSFTILAINRKGPGPAATAVGLRQSAGRPGTPQNLKIGYADDTATNSTKVKISWTPVTGAEVQGPTPVKYTLTRSPGGVVSCPPQDSTCYDNPTYGQSYTYSVTARNAADDAAPGRHTSSPATTPPFEIATKPDAVSNYSTQATGQDGTAKLTFDAPASHGKSSTIKCTRDDGVDCGSWPYPPAGATGQTQTISGLQNGRSTAVTLVDCNGSTDSNNAKRTCGDGVSQSVTTYGPIAPVQLNVSSNGTRIYWSYSGNANGKSAHISVRTSHGYSRDFDSSGGFSGSDSEDVGYSYTDTVTVTVTDPGRTTQQASGSARSVDPPPPSIIAGKSTGYMTGTAGTCTSAANRCYGLNVSVRNFPTGKYTWSCQNNSGTYYTSTAQITISDPNQDFGDKNWCLNGYSPQTIYITINKVQSNGVAF